MPKFNHLSLHTERLLLRPLRETDAPAIFAIRSNPTVMRYHTSQPWTEIKRAVALIERDMAAMQSGQHLSLGLERTEDKVLIGTCSLFELNEQCRRAEIGYELRHDAWGKGYMHEALLALLEYGFSTLELNRLEADIHPDNTNSAKSLERLGFIKEGYFRERWIVGDEMSDSVMYGLLHSDWRAKNH
ncbi:MAG TPA: GNAT family N-acetyltransferase [Burkholderiaceae bacterium]|jgi:ribosomal-protein-alanine N-acetyltransferase|nr:GNAT family N-acetyltransferase [Burkholderiaceae bacterium]